MPADSGTCRIIGHEQLCELFRITPGEFTDARPQRQKEIRNFRPGPNAPRLVFVAASEMSGKPLRDDAVHLDLREGKLLDLLHKRPLLINGDKFRPVNKPYWQITAK